MKKKKILIITLSSVFGFIVLIFLIFGIYVLDYYKANDSALDKLNSTDLVTVEEEKGNIYFIPKNYTSGLIFYPGGKVEASAYAPLMMEIAENGILCVLVEMPFNLAVFDINAANDILDNFQDVSNWYMAGHSLGGSMAASYLKNNSSKFKGLFLLASYSTVDLSSTELDVLLITGSNDLVVNKEKYEECKTNLPNDYYEVLIMGGNHAYFGSYGEQDGDGTANITNDEQIEFASNRMVEIIKRN